MVEKNAIDFLVCAYSMMKIMVFLLCSAQLGQILSKVATELFVCLFVWTKVHGLPTGRQSHLSFSRTSNWIFTLQKSCEQLIFFIKCDFKMVLTTFFFAFLHTIKLPQYIWKGNLLLLKCIPSFSHERRILGPLLECRLWLAVVHPTVKYTTISAVFCITLVFKISLVLK